MWRFSRETLTITPGISQCFLQTVCMDGEHRHLCTHARGHVCTHTPHTQSPRAHMHTLTGGLPRHRGAVCG